MTDYPGSGDPKRTLDLLWRVAQQRSRGPRPALAIEQVVEAAVAVADEGGLDALSIRSVAKRLGTSPMSIYTYVPSKAELLDLVHDHVLGELRHDYSQVPHWRDAMEAYVRDHLAVYSRHPWMAHLSLARTALGPNSFGVLEIQTSILSRLHLMPLQLTAGASAIDMFLNGVGRAVTDARAAASATGMTDDEWWQARAPLLADITADHDFAVRYPTLSRLESERAFEQPLRAPDDTTSYMEREILDGFELGLTLLLDGLQALSDAAAKASRRRKAPAPSPSAE